MEISTNRITNLDFLTRNSCSSKIINNSKSNKISTSNRVCINRLFDIGYLPITKFPCIVCNCSIAVCTCTEKVNWQIIDRCSEFRNWWSVCYINRRSGYCNRFCCCRIGTWIVSNCQCNGVSTRSGVRMSGSHPTRITPTPQIRGYKKYDYVKFLVLKKLDFIKSQKIKKNNNW